MLSANRLVVGRLVDRIFETFEEIIKWKDLPLVAGISDTDYLFELMQN